MVKFRFINNETARNFLTLFTGSALAQLIPFAFEPILTRLFTPPQFAVLALYISVANLFVIIATGRYELAIMLPKTNRQSINIVALSFMICCGVAVVSLIVISIFNHGICTLLNNHTVGPYLFLIPLSVLLTGSYQIVNYWMTRQKQFAGVSTGRVAQTTTNALLNLGTGFLKTGHAGLIWSYLGGISISFVTIISFVKKADFRQLRLINRKEILLMAKRYSDFPKINSLHAFTDILQQSLLIFLLSYFFSDTIVGSYSRTFRLLAAPSSLIGTAIGQIYFQQASSRIARGESIKDLTLKLIKGLAFIAIPGFSMVVLFGGPLFSFLLGKAWYSAGLYAGAIAPWLCVNFITSPVSTLPLIIGKQKIAFLISLIGNSLILLSIFYGGYVSHNVMTGFYMLSGVMLVYYTFLIRWYLKLATLSQQT